MSMLVNAGGYYKVDGYEGLVYVHSVEKNGSGGTISATCGVGAGREWPPAFRDRVYALPTEPIDYRARLAPEEFLERVSVVGKPVEVFARYRPDVHDDNPIEDYLTVEEWCGLHEVTMGAAPAARIGKAATAKCKEAGVPIGKRPHPIYRTINAYPSKVLDGMEAEIRAMAERFKPAALS